MQSSNFDKQTNKRKSNIELLRIISMLMIVFHHFGVHGGFEWKASNITIPYLWCNLIVIGGKIGVDIFVLISGYFLITSQGEIFNLKKILKLWGQIIFYSLGIVVIFILIGNHNYNVKILIKSVFPIIFSSWWFASAYFVLYIIHPFLNIFLNMLSKKNYQTFLILLIIMWSVIPTITTSEFQSNSLGWFLTLYAIAGYARLYGFNKIYTTKKYFILCLIFFALTYSLSLMFVVLGARWSVFFNHATYFYGMEKLPTLLISLTLFMGFVTLKIDYHKWINTLASATFGVYLIHDNNIVRPFLWIDVFQNFKYQNSLFLIPYSILVVIFVYMICTFIDLIRQRIFEKPFMFIVNKYADNIVRSFVKMCNVLKKIMFG